MKYNKPLSLHFALTPTQNVVTQNIEMKVFGFLYILRCYYISRHYGAIQWTVKFFDQLIHEIRKKWVISEY